MCRRISVYLALLTKTDFHSIISLVNFCHSDVGLPDFCILSKTKNLCGYAEISDVFDFAVRQTTVSRVFPGCSAIRKRKTTGSEAEKFTTR